MGGGSAFGGPGFSTKNLFGFAKKGGGLSDLVYRQQGGGMGLGSYTDSQADRVQNQLDAALEREDRETARNSSVRNNLRNLVPENFNITQALLGLPSGIETEKSIRARNEATKTSQEEALRADLDSRKELTEERVASKERFAREQADKSREALKGYDPAILSNLAVALLNPDYAEAGFLGAAGTGLAMGIEARQETLKKNKAELRKIDSDLAAALDANEDMLFESAISGLDKKTAQAMEFIRGDAEVLERISQIPANQRKEVVDAIVAGSTIDAAFAKAAASRATAKTIPNISAVQKEISAALTSRGFGSLVDGAFVASGKLYGDKRAASIVNEARRSTIEALRKNPSQPDQALKIFNSVLDRLSE